MEQSFIRMPPDSTGKSVRTVLHSDTNTHGQVYHLADSTTPTHTQAIDNRGAASIRFAEGQPILSGFGLLKTAQEVALGVYESSLDSYMSMFTEFVTGNGLRTYNVAEASEILSVDGSADSSIRITTNRSHYYMPGTSNTYKMTLSCSDSGKEGNYRRWGAFDENDGVFFELFNTTFNVVIRSSVTGTVTDLKVPRSQWNADKLDGTGLSGYILDLTKINVWWIDYQWLGAGRVRFGIFSPDGTRVVCHAFENAGNNNLPYMQTGNLPFSTENKNVSATGASSEIRLVCVGVYAEGNVLDAYTFWRYSTGILSKSVTTPQTLIAAYRPVATINSRRNRVQIYPETLNVYCTAPIGITLFQTSDYTGGTWTNAGAGSVLERSTDGTFVYASSESFTTFFCNTGVNTFDLRGFFELNDEGIQVAADGTPQIWSLLASPLTEASAEVKVNVSYKELW